MTIHKVNRVLLIISVVIVSLSLSGQTILFEKAEHDFGVIKEEDGTVHYMFKFVNKGYNPFHVINVEAECGCTAPLWPKEMIDPGDTSYVSVAYDPLGRPGVFRKSLTVKTNAIPAEVEIKIKGFVTPTDEPEIVKYPFKSGGLELVSQYILIGNVLNNQIAEKQVDVHNRSDYPITINKVEVYVDFLNVSLSKNTIEPNETSSITVMLDAPNVKQLGYETYPLILHTSDTTNPKKALVISANVEEYFPKFSAKELAKQPKITFDREESDFGRITEGQKVTKDFAFRNDGKKDLIIRSTKGSCGCTVGELSKDIIPAGESGIIKVIFDSTGREGRQYKTLIVYCNDPTSPKKVLILTGIVNKDD